MNVMPQYLIDFHFIACFSFAVLIKQIGGRYTSWIAGVELLAELVTYWICLSKSVILVLGGVTAE